MRRADNYNESLFTTVRLESFVPANHPLRPIRTWLNDTLANMDAKFLRCTKPTSKVGGPASRRKNSCAPCCCKCCTACAATLGTGSALGSGALTVAGASTLDNSAPLARNTALVGLQAEVELSRRSALVLGYNGEYGSGSAINRLM